MSDEPTVTRHEIMEERANRDAFRLCVLILVVVALGLVVLGIAAWNSRFMLMPIVPRDPAPRKTLSTARQPGTPHRTVSRPWIALSLFSCGDTSAPTTCEPVPPRAARDQYSGGRSLEAITLHSRAEAAGSQTISIA